MALTPQDHQLIEQYLLGQLSEQDTILFNSKIQQPEFAAALQFQQAVMDAARIQGELDMKALLQSAESDLHKEQDTTPLFRKTFKRTMAIAATLLLLIAAWWWFGQQQKTSGPELFAAHFEPYPNVLYPLERGATPVTPPEKVFEQYENGDYESALMGLETLLQDTIDPALVFYKGIILLKQQNTSEAIEIFTQLSKEGTSQFSRQAAWYLALTHLQNNQSGLARPLLEKVIQDKSYEWEKATTILREIE